MNAELVTIYVEARIQSSHECTSTLRSEREKHLKNSHVIKGGSLTGLILPVSEGSLLIMLPQRSLACLETLFHLSSNGNSQGSPHTGRRRLQ